MGVVRRGQAGAGAARGAPRRTCARPGHQPHGRHEPREQALLADSVGLAGRGAGKAGPRAAAGVRAARHARVPFEEIASRWIAPPRRHGSSPVGPAAGCGAPPPGPWSGMSPASARWSIPSSPPHSGDLDALVAVLEPDVVANRRGTARPSASRVFHGGRLWPVGRCRLRSRWHRSTRS
jgi:hypothetical protein